MQYDSRGPTRTDSELTASRALTKFLFVGMGIAMLIGLLCGIAWTIYGLAGGSFGD